MGSISYQFQNLINQNPEGIEILSDVFDLEIDKREAEDILLYRFDNYLINEFGREYGEVKFLKTFFQHTLFGDEFIFSRYKLILSDGCIFFGNITAFLDPDPSIDNPKDKDFLSDYVFMYSISFGDRDAFPGMMGPAMEILKSNINW